MTGNEYRWEIEGIGQGHYYISLKDCVDDAYAASIAHPKDYILIERFKPTRRTIARLKNGMDYKQ
jgi:hypothetical protein